jgi:hypothetical protein
MDLAAPRDALKIVKYILLANIATDRVLNESKTFLSDRGG